MAFEATRVSPIFGVRRVREAAEYYRDVLGFSLDPAEGVFQPTADEPDGVYGIVKLGPAWIHFQIRRNEIPVRPREKFERDAYVQVEEIDAMYANVCSRGANIVHEPVDAPYGFREFTIEDLNGFRVTFGELR